MEATPSNIQSQSDFAHNGRPWWKACCIGCLVLIVAVVVGSSIIFRVLVGPSNRVITSLPSGYPSALQPYRVSDATKITYVPGKGKSMLLQILMAPVRLVASVVGTTSSTQAGMATSFKQGVDTYSEQLKGLDTVTFSWKGLSARHEDVMVYYADQFKRAGMQVQAYRNESTETDIVLAQGAGTAAQLTIQDTTAIPDIDDIELNVEYAVQH